MDQITRLSKAAMGGDAEAFAELVRLARCAPETKRANGVERRILPATFETKAEGRRIIGYGSTFESPENYDSYGDIIRAGAFAASLARHKQNGTTVKMHNQHLDVVGQWDVVEEDVDGTRGKRGLYVEGEPLTTTVAEDMLKLVHGGICKGLSIGFSNTVARFLDGFEGRPLVLTKWGYPVREIVELELIEVSIVDNPANPYAEILEVREARKEIKHAPPLNHDSILRCVQLACAASIIRSHAA